MLLSLCVFSCFIAPTAIAEEASGALRFKVTRELTRDVSTKFDADDFSKYTPLTLLEHLPENENGETSSHYVGNNQADGFNVEFSTGRTIYKVWEHAYIITFVNTHKEQDCVTVGSIVPYARAKHWARKGQWSDPVDFHIKMERNGVDMQIVGFANLPFPEPWGPPPERISPDADLSDYCVRTLSFRY